MRIIGGKYRGRRFNPPADKWPTRPTTDVAKEGLFNILTNRFDFEEIKALDLFGGTGSLTYELLSRGCESVVYVDKFSNCVKFVRQTLETLGATDLVQIYQMDVFKYMETSHLKFDYIFAGPPYGLPTIDTIPDKIFEHQLLAEGGLFIMEHNPNHDFVNHPRLVDVRNYGKTIFSFFQLEADETNEESTTESTEETTD